MITTKLKSFDTIDIIATTSSSITLSLTGIGLIVALISTAIACGLTISNKVLYEILMRKYNKYKKLCDKDQQTNKSFDKIYRKSLKDNLIDENEYESSCVIYTNYVDETRTESFFLMYEHKVKLNSFSTNKLKIKPEPRC